MDLEPGPDDGEYFEIDQKCSSRSSPEIQEPDESSESDDIIELSSDSDEEKEERGYDDDAELHGCWGPTPSDERGERVLIHINTETQKDRSKPRRVPSLLFFLFHAETRERAGLWKLWMENTSFLALCAKKR